MALILIIENDLDIQENLVELLALEGYKTIASSNGKEGIELAIAHLPDLVLCNVMMPNMDGFEVAQAIRSISAKPIKIAFLSARAELVFVQRGLLCADAYLVKPFSCEMLLDTVASLILVILD